MQSYQTQAKMFKVLMHPTRLAILEILRDGEQCVCHMEAMFGLRQAAISQQLMVLREAGWVTDRRDGWNIFYRVTRPEIYKIIDAMNAFSGAARDVNSGTDFSTKETTCPCPKCNSGVEFPTWGNLDQAAIKPGSTDKAIENSRR